MKLYINKISENNSEYIELKEGKILIHREKIDPLLQVAVGDVVIIISYAMSSSFSDSSILISLVTK